MTMLTTLVIGAAAVAAGGTLLGLLGRNRNVKEHRKGFPVGPMLIGAMVGIASAYTFFRPSGTIPEITSENDFQQKVLEAKQPVVVDFFAVNCVYCHRLEPRLEKLADDYKGKVDFVKVDVNKFRKLKDRYEIEGWPTVVFFYKGEAVTRIVALNDTQEYKDTIEAILKK